MTVDTTDQFKQKRRSYLKNRPAREFIKAFAKFLKKGNKFKMPEVSFCDNLVSFLHEDCLLQGARPRRPGLAVSSRCFHRLPALHTKNQNQKAKSYYMKI